MKIKLVFEDWQKDGKSVYQTPEGIYLSLGNFHSGTTFDADIDLDAGDEKELQRAIDAGFVPVFVVVK